MLSSGVKHTGSGKARKKRGDKNEAKSSVPPHFFQLTKKKAGEKFGKWSDIAQIGRWLDNFSSAPCFVL